MPKQVKEAYENYIEHNTWFKVLSVCAILLLIAGFVCPPLAIIDSSVLLGASEIFAFAALWTVIKAIDKGRIASISHGQTTISVGKDTDGNGIDDDYESEQETEELDG